MSCPVIPLIRRYRPDLLNEAKLVGNDVPKAIKFLKKHRLWTKEMKISQEVTEDEDRETLRLVSRKLRIRRL